MITLTKRQREILTKMRDEDEEIAASGSQVWCGDEKTSWAVLDFFITHLLVSQDNSESMYYHINQSGKLLLDGRRDIYRTSDGSYVEYEQLLALMTRPAEQKG